MISIESNLKTHKALLVKKYKQERKDAVDITSHFYFENKLK